MATHAANGKLTVFFNDVEDFQSDLKQYVSDVYRFTNEQIDYANALRSVAQQAEAYADCEMNDLMSEIGQ